MENTSKLKYESIGKCIEINRHQNKSRSMKKITVELQRYALTKQNKEKKEEKGRKEKRREK